MSRADWFGFRPVESLSVLQDLQESEVCQDELALRVKQLKAELVLFKGLVSNVSFVCFHSKCRFRCVEQVWAEPTHVLV